MSQGPTEKYSFQESLSQIIDDASHPLHKTYVEALTTIRRPCSHEAVNLERNPEDVFSDGVMDYLVTNHQTHLLPIQEAMCDDFTREYQLYAYLGSGSFGAVFAARTIQRGKDGKYLHVAVKFSPIQIAAHQTGGLIRHDKFGLISNEVLAMALLRDDPGVPKVYAVYAHGCTFITVMELFGVWPNTNELENLPPFNFTDDVADVVRLRPCDGTELWGPDCYIPGHKITEEMDVKLIDWGAMQIHPSEEKWYNDQFSTVHEEDFRPPEWALSGRALLLSKEGNIVDDHRRNDLWRMSCVIYYYLHGEFPFTARTSAADAALRARHGELEVKDGLSQDCIDALMVMLEQNPQTRGKTEDLATLPWLSGFYVDSDHIFQNALQSPFTPRIPSHRDVGGNDPPSGIHECRVICHGDRIVSDHRSLYRCFAQWKFRDQDRWKEIKENALLQYHRFMQRPVRGTPTEDDALQFRVYQGIDRSIPGGIDQCFQDDTRSPPLRLIRLITDSLSCQAILLTNPPLGEPTINIYGNVRDKIPPFAFQIHLYHDEKVNLFDTILLYHPENGAVYRAHISMDPCEFGLDMDHRANLESLQLKTRLQGPRSAESLETSEESSF